jgi:hypothetical protein
LSKAAQNGAIHSINSVAHAGGKSVDGALATLLILNGELADNLETAFFNYGVREHFFGDALNLCVCFFARHAFQIEYEKLSLSHFANSRVTERRQRLLNCFTLRIEYGYLWHHPDVCFHAASIPRLIVMFRILIPLGAVRFGLCAGCFVLISAHRAIYSFFSEAKIMILGMSLSTYTTIHVVLSLIAIFTGFIVVFGMFDSKKLKGMTAIFLLTSILTSAGGFLFPNDHITPGIILGILSLFVLLIAIITLYALNLSGASRGTYAVTAVMALYFNFFALVAQSFAKIPALHSLAPTGKEPAFFIAQGIALVLFIVFGIFAVKKFHPGNQLPARA